MEFANKLKNGFNNFVDWSRIRKSIKRTKKQPESHPRPSEKRFRSIHRYGFFKHIYLILIKVFQLYLYCHTKLGLNSFPRYKLRNRNHRKFYPHKSSLYSTYGYGQSGEHKLVKTKLPNYLSNIRNGIGKLIEWSGISNVLQKKDRDLPRPKTNQRYPENKVWKNFKRR